VRQPLSGNGKVGLHSFCLVSAVNDDGCRIVRRVVDVADRPDFGMVPSLVVEMDGVRRSWHPSEDPRYAVPKDDGAYVHGAHG
jgi:hypothetical protein